MVNNKLQRTEIFTEILASDKLSSGYQFFGQDQWATALAENPSAAWQQLKYNPWLAMAIYADMEEKDAAVFSALDTRKNNVLSKTRNIIPASDRRQDRKIADFVEESLDRYFQGFESFLYEALDAVGKGVSIGEIIFAEAADRIYIEQVKFKPQHLFSFGDTAIAGFSTASMTHPQTGPLQLRAGVIMDGLAVGEVLPEDKFFVFSFRPKYNNRWGDPVDRKAFWPSWIKRSSIKEWLRYQEKGTGVVIAKYPSSAGMKEQDDALGAADAVRNETAVAIPDKFELEVHEMVRQLGSSHKELVDDFCNAEIFRIFLGQTLTSKGSDGGGSRALGEVHERKEDAIAETDCKALMQAVQCEIIKPLVFLNFGPDADCPQWLIEYEPKEDLDSKAKRYGIIHKEIGLELSKQQDLIRKEFRAIGGDPEILRFNSGRRTSFIDDTDIIRIRGDIFPIEKSEHPRSRMSVRAVLAHELQHLRRHPSKFKHNDWRDEFRASYHAAVDTPNLTDRDRHDLMDDAIRRAEEAGQKIRKTSRMRKILGLR